MKIEHIAIWVENLEKMKTFYSTYFEMVAGAMYQNHQKHYASYFLAFPDSTTRMELMKRNDITISPSDRGQQLGVAHLAISVGSKEMVELITDRLREDGFTVEGEPRTTGDGYYESVVLDPEGNLVEITI